ncbi:MAG: hypothetical protein WDA22_15720 [Bacteroidota bacterium]
MENEELHKKAKKYIEEFLDSTYRWTEDADNTTFFEALKDELEDTLVRLWKTKVDYEKFFKEIIADYARLYRRFEKRNYTIKEIRRDSKKYKDHAEKFMKHNVKKETKEIYDEIDATDADMQSKKAKSALSVAIRLVAHKHQMDEKKLDYRYRKFKERERKEIAKGKLKSKNLRHSIVQKS